MLIKFLVLAGGVFWVFWVFFGGGEGCQFYFYGREDFSEISKAFPCLEAQQRYFSYRAIPWERE